MPRQDRRCRCPRPASAATRPPRAPASAGRRPAPSPAHAPVDAANTGSDAPQSDLLCNAYGRASGGADVQGRYTFPDECRRVRQACAETKPAWQIAWPHRQLAVTRCDTRVQATMLHCTRRTFFSEAGRPPAPSACGGFERNMSSSSIARTPAAPPTRGFFAAAAAGGASAGLRCSSVAALSMCLTAGRTRHRHSSHAAERRRQRRHCCDWLVPRQRGPSAHML